MDVHCTLCSLNRVLIDSYRRSNPVCSSVPIRALRKKSWWWRVIDFSSESLHEKTREGHLCITHMRILLLALDAASDCVKITMKVFFVLLGALSQFNIKGHRCILIKGSQACNKAMMVLCLSCIAWSRSRDIYRNNASQVTNQRISEWLEIHPLTTCLTRAELQKCEIVCQRILLCLDLYCATADCRWHQDGSPG